MSTVNYGLAVLSSPSLLGPVTCQTSRKTFQKRAYTGINIWDELIKEMLAK